MKRERVGVDNLLLWEANPRVEAADSQMDELDKIYNFSNPSSQNTSKRQLMKLIESIAVNGYQNDVEPILTVRKGQKFVVQDANRRLSSIKLLRNPDRYRDILDEKDYRRVKSLSEEYPTNIPSHLYVVVFEDDEEATLKDILSRKHNGPLDGVGTLPWSTEAKGRFFAQKKSLADRLEAPFEEQFGQSLTSYLGGSNAITSTRRVFGFSDVKKYLNIEDEDNITSDELDRVKEFADEIKGYCQEHEMLLSRLRKDDVRQNIIIPLQEKKNSTTVTPLIAVKRTRQELLGNVATNRDRHPGARYNNQSWLDINNPDFLDVNFLLVGLAANGKLDGEGYQRWAKAYLLAPAIRVIYELSLLSIVKADIGVVLPQCNVSKEHKKNVNVIHELFKTDPHFLQFLSEGRIVFDTFSEAQSVIMHRDFGASVDDANLASHKSAKDYSIQTVIDLFDDAVLFAVLCQQYTLFKKSDRGN